VAALGAAAAQYSCACLGLHAGKKPVGLCAVAAVRLESTLRHLTRLLLRAELLINFFAVCNSPSVYPKQLPIPKRTANEGLRRSGRGTRENEEKAWQIRPSQGMVQRKFLSLPALKSTSFSVLLSNPLTNDEFGLFEIVLWFTVSFFFAEG
jgi:hypothetical protein